MTGQELAIALSAKTGLTRRSAAEVLQAVTETIMDAVRDGDKVTIAGFGTFLLAQRAPRKGRNPRTGAEMAIPAHKYPRFVASKRFNELAR